MIALAEVETIGHLREWVSENLPNAYIESTESEVVIHLGLVETMGGYLELAEEEE
jgi:hypothetical protein